MFFLLSFVCWDISIGAVVFGLASHREVLGDERLHEAVHLAPLPRVHFIARAARRATVPRRWAHHCSDSSLKKRRRRTHTHMKVHRSVWVGGKRTWTSWVVTYAARWPSCIPVCGVVAAHLSPSMSISEISLLCYAWLGVWSTLQKKCHLSVCVGCIFFVLASSSLWIPLYSHTLKTIVWACLSLLEQERVVLPLPSVNG